MVVHNGIARRNSFCAQTLARSVMKAAQLLEMLGGGAGDAGAAVRLKYRYAERGRERGREGERKRKSRAEQSRTGGCLGEIL